MEGMVTIIDDQEVKKVISDDDKLLQITKGIGETHIEDAGDASDPELSERSDSESSPTELLYKCLVVKRQPVVFIGESPNPSLPIALAVLRGNMEGIWATSRKPLEKKWTSSEFDEVLKEQITRAEMIWELKTRGTVMSPTDRGKAYGKFDAFKTYLKTNRPRVTELLERFVEGADATNLQSSFAASNLEIPTQNIWFQCPWRDFGDSNQTSDLLTSFLKSAAEVQVPGDMLIIGLTKHTAYVRKYKLEGFMDCATNCGYKHLVTDNHLIDQVLDLGYNHVALGGIDIHDILFNHHQSYVFEKTVDE